jgi:transcription initiation factor TFIIIB Brf1 subunit/transcription initiation factor TFIIB
MTLNQWNDTQALLQDLLNKRTQLRRTKTYFLRIQTSKATDYIILQALESHM